MSTINWSNVSKELTNELRNSDSLTIAQRGVTTGTSSQTGNGSEVNYLVNVNNAKNVRSVTVASVTKTYVTDYDFDLDYNDSGTIKLRITFTTAPADQAAIVITYDYGADRVFDDSPRAEYKLGDVPRIHWEYQAGRSEEVDTVAGYLRTTQLVSATIIAADVTTLNTVITTLRGWFKTRNKSLYYIKLVRFTGMGPVLKSEGRSDELFQRNVDFTLTFDLES